MLTNGTSIVVRPEPLNVVEIVTLRGPAGPNAPAPWLKPPLANCYAQYGTGPQGTVTYTSGRAYLFPVILPTMNVTAVQADVTTAAVGGTALLGLYAESDGNLPDLSSPVATFGSVSTTATGLVQWLANVNIAAGVYWLCLLTLGNNATLRCQTNGSNLPVGFRSGEVPVSGNAHFSRSIAGQTGLPVGGVDAPNSNPVPSLRWRRGT
jgi:hypothetical protein